MNTFLWISDTFLWPWAIVSIVIALVIFFIAFFIKIIIAFIEVFIKWKLNKNLEKVENIISSLQLSIIQYETNNYLKNYNSLLVKDINESILLIKQKLGKPLDEKSLSWKFNFNKKLKTILNIKHHCFQDLQSLINLFRVSLKENVIFTEKECNDNNIILKRKLLEIDLTINNIKKEVLSCSNPSII